MNNEKYPHAPKAAEGLRANRVWLARAQGLHEQGIEETDHNPPSQGHYDACYLWDEVAADTMSAVASTVDGPKSAYYLNASKRGFHVLVDGIGSDGFLPNYRYLNKPQRKFDPEMTLAFGRGAMSSNYTQPPILALGARNIYEASVLHGENPQEFLDETYPKLARYYGYVDRELSNSETDKLIGVYHPHMTGRDSDPVFDEIKTRIPRRGADTPKVIDKLNIALDYGSIIKHGVKLRMAGDKVEQWREVYWMNDVMMNCVYVDNLRDMAELANAQNLITDTRDYHDKADAVERAILEKMWLPDARDGRGLFANLDKKGEPIDEVSISNLFPLTLPNINEHQVTSLLDLLEDEFNTPCPLPSVSTKSQNFDPHNQESWRLWRGPKWMITDWYIVERGLWRQAERKDIDAELTAKCIAWANKIKNQSQQTLNTEGAREHYDPYTGKGQRNAVKNFGWSYLGYLMREE